MWWYVRFCERERKMKAAKERASINWKRESTEKSERGIWDWIDWKGGDIGLVCKSKQKNIFLYKCSIQNAILFKSIEKATLRNTVLVVSKSFPGKLAAVMMSPMPKLKNTISLSILNRF